MRREAKLERYLVEQVEALDGLSEKFVSPGRRGPPDRLNTFMGGIMHLVELKDEDGELRPEQIRDHERRWLLGVRVFVLRSKDAVDEYIRGVRVILNRGRA